MKDPEYPFDLSLMAGLKGQAQVLNIRFVGSEADMPVRQRMQTGIPIHFVKMGTED